LGVFLKSLAFVIRVREHPKQSMQGLQVMPLDGRRQRRFNLVVARNISRIGLAHIGQGAVTTSLISTSTPLLPARIPGCQTWVCRQPVCW
jgi:hypothetical protein